MGHIINIIKQPATRRVCFAFLVAIFISSFINNSAFAASTSSGVITDANNIRWEYELIDDADNTDEPQKLILYFYDKPESLGTVTVPSLSELINLVPNSNANLNTYYLKSANTSAQDTNYPSLTRRVATVETTKLDMQNTSKIQILGVKPIINPAVETELVFGPNMVIGERHTKRIRANVCNPPKDQWTDFRWCNDYTVTDFDIPNWEYMTDAQIEAVNPTPGKIGCIDINTASSTAYESGRCFVDPYSLTKVDASLGRAFMGYKLKLTNFDVANFNYIGWEAFAETTLHDTVITISGDIFLGTDIFRGSNVTKAIIQTNNIGEGIFRDCANLTEVVFADDVTRVTNDAFAGTGLTSFNFSATNIKTIGPRAFAGAKLASINLDGVERIEYRAFQGNQIEELYLPKSIKYLQAELFRDNVGMRKLTVAYDTLTSGTTLPLFVVLDNVYSKQSIYSSQPINSIEEVIIIAPYGENENVSATHILYDQYKYNYHPTTQEYLPGCNREASVMNSCNSSSAAGNDYGWDNNTPYDAYGRYQLYSSYGMNNFPSLGVPSKLEDDYADVDSKKNIIAPIYFAQLHNLKKITIGEGFEYIGSSAFIDWDDLYSSDTARFLKATPSDYELHLPSTLKGIGNHAFDNVFDTNYVDFTIPQDIEFIGASAFKNVLYDKDVDFPNLVALGDFAFARTMTKNVYLHDKIQYMGIKTFTYCFYLNDITFDFDVFSDDIYVAWAQPHRSGRAWYDAQFRLTTEFGPDHGFMLPESITEEYGIRTNRRKMNGDEWPFQFGTITFTDKNVSQLPSGYNLCYYVDQEGSPGCPGGVYVESNINEGIHNTLFGHLSADKIDIGNTAWEYLSPRMFVRIAADEVVLPQNLKVIPGDSFSDALIKNELILPDTVQVIGDAAFDYGGFYDNFGFGLEFGPEDTVKITKLPESLGYVGNDAFYGDYNLTADLNSPNLAHVYRNAFMGTRLRDVYLPNTIKMLRSNAFGNISTLRNITIDFDLGSLPPNYVESFANFDWPQSVVDFAGSNLQTYITMSCNARRSAYRSNNSSNSEYSPVSTFYNLFSQSFESDSVDANNNIVYGQKAAANHFGKLVFTENATTDIYMVSTGFFSGLEFDEIDLSATGWKNTVTVPYAFEDTKIGTLKLPSGLETITLGAFENAEITNPFALPSTVKTINGNAFQWAEGEITNMLPDSVETIGQGAFYGTDMSDELAIPASVTSIGESAFNAGGADVHYDTVTIKPDLTNQAASGQLTHQLLWANDIDKLIVDSSVLPGIDQDRGDSEGEQEFWHMTMDEVVINNLPKITRAAFEGCENLQKVDLGQDSALRAINREAFLNDEALHIINFSPDIKNENVYVGPYAFKNTAFTTIGDGMSDIDLTAAKFNGTDGYAFSEMPKLVSVDVPNSFSAGTIPEATFANDAELVEATIDYRTTLMGNAAFANDDKLERIFIWGNTTVLDENLPGYVAPTGGMGADDDETPEFGPTIPEGTDIYAYSTSPAEKYAASDSRASFEGNFYPLDEVLYITSNDPTVEIYEDPDDFDKTNVTVYALRRDGVILESDTWGEFDGTVYPRSEKELHFEKMLPTIAADPEFGTIWDTPVPLNELDYSNENFSEINFQFIRDQATEGVKLINVVYTDAYTRGTPDTDIDPYTDAQIPDLPITLAINIARYLGMFALLMCVVIFVAKGNLARRRR